jgi:CRP-like cAMP-binding protein
VNDPAQATISLYLQKLERRGALSASAREALLALPTRQRAYSTYQDIVREGDRPTHCCFVQSGLVSRYKTLRNGSRQIVSFHIAGDMVDLSSALVMVADHGIRTHAPTMVVSIAHEDVLRVAADFPEIGRAFWFDTLIDAAIFREWTVNVGRRNASERTAHLLLEFAYRFKAAELMVDDTFVLPVSQVDLSDALGITPVHLNRTLQWLRANRYIRTHSRTVSIEKWPEMLELAGFTSAYLHPEGPRTLDRGII